MKRTPDIAAAAAATREHVKSVLGTDDSDEATLLRMIRTAKARGFDRTEVVMLLGVLEDHFAAKVKDEKKAYKSPELRPLEVPETLFPGVGGRRSPP